MKYIAVNYDKFAEECLKLDHGSGTISVTNTPSDKVKCDDKKAWCGEIAITIAGYQSGAIGNSDGTGSGSIKGSGTMLIDGKAAVLEEDESSLITISGSTGTPASPATDYVTVKVKKAGQTKVMGA